MIPEVTCVTDDGNSYAAIRSTDGTPIYFTEAGARWHPVESVPETAAERLLAKLREQPRNRCIPIPFGIPRSIRDEVASWLDEHSCPGCGGNRKGDSVRALLRPPRIATGPWCWVRPCDCEAAPEPAGGVE